VIKDVALFALVFATKAMMLAILVRVPSSAIAVPKFELLQGGYHVNDWHLYLQPFSRLYTARKQK